jgi:type II secretory pathway component GspD/PulD (secretin)
MQPKLLRTFPTGTPVAARQFSSSEEAWTSPARTLNVPPAPGVQTNQRIKIPVANPESYGRVNISSSEGKISLIVRDAPLGAVLGHIAEHLSLNIVSSEDTDTRISVTLTNVPLKDALNSILSIAGYTWVRQKDIVVISKIAAGSNVSPYAQGRHIRVIPLNYVAPKDVEEMVTKLLSPVGRTLVMESSPLDKRKTRNLIVVEDLPEYLSRIEEYISQIDYPPKQVLIEAHILQVDLDDETRHGVDFEYLTKLAGTNVSLRTAGFANDQASPAFFLGIDGTDLDALLEAIKLTTNAKTLASPKVLVVNGQEARIQIGGQLGYLVTTTTETSTLQNVDFLDVGVVLRVTPQISDDNRILMSVKPEVSSGQINPDTGLPEEETTEVETTVMLPDGRGMIIGGLIKEEDIDRQSKIPLLGDLWLVGRLFQRRTVIRKRSEIIIALVPRIVSYEPHDQFQGENEVNRATTRLLDPPLKRASRPWEPQLPDAIHNPRRLKFSRLLHFFHNLRETHPRPLEHYLPSVNEENTWISDDHFLSDNHSSETNR